MKPIEKHELDLSNNQLLYEAIKISVRTVKELKYKNLSLFIAGELKKLINTNKKIAFGVDIFKDNYVDIFVFDEMPDGNVSIVTSNDGGETFEKIFSL